MLQTYKVRILTLPIEMLFVFCLGENKNKKGMKFIYYKLKYRPKLKEAGRWCLIIIVFKTSCIEKRVDLQHLIKLFKQVQTVFLGNK